MAARPRDSKAIQRYDTAKVLVLLALTGALLVQLSMSGALEGAGTDVADAGTPLATLVADDAAGDSTADDGTVEDGDAAPDLSSPPAGSQVAPGQTEFSGIGQPGTTTRIVVDGLPVAEAVVDDSGMWSAPVNLPAGAQEVVLQTVDSSGNIVDESEPIPIQVGEAGDTAAGDDATPTDEGTDVAATAESPDDATTTEGSTTAEDAGATDEAGDATDEDDAADEAPGDTSAAPGEEPGSEAGGPVAVNPPDEEALEGQATVSGTGPAGSRVVATVNGETVGETTVAPNGTWSMPVELPAGVHDVVVQTVDAAGNAISEANASLEVEAPAYEEVDLPASGQPTFDPVTGEHQLTGEAQPGETVEVVVDGEVVGTVMADEEGQWSLAAALSATAESLVIRARDPVGNITRESQEIPLDVAAVPPSIEMPGERVPSAADEGATGDTGGEGQSSTDDRMPAVDLTEGATTLEGVGAPGSVVEVVVNGLSAGLAAVDDAGRWQLDVSLPEGTYDLVLRGLDEAGNRLTSSRPAPIAVISSEQPKFITQVGALPPGVNQVTGTAEPGATVVVLVNGLEAARVVAGSDGLWTTTVTLPDDAAELQVQALDEDGAVAAESAAVSTDGSAEPQPVGDVAQGAGTFSILLEAAQTADLADVLNAPGPYTVFAPPDAAFDTIPEEILDSMLADPAEMSTILQNFIVAGQYLAADIASSTFLESISGSTIPVEVEGDQIKVGGAVIIGPDIGAANGVVHVIDRVLLPPLPVGVPPPVIDGSGVATFTGDVLTVVGTAAPGKLIVVDIQGENLGPMTTVDLNGNWAVTGNVTPGEYRLVAFMVDPTGQLLAASDPVYLTVR